MPRPFEQSPFDSLPESPRVPHHWASVRRRSVTVDSAHFGRVPVAVAELGEGPPLLLIHGLMWRGYSWRYAIGPLSRDWTAIAIDLPGAGDTPAPDVPFHPEALATFLAEVVDALGVRGCACVANSMGGMLALRAALRDPGLFSRVVDLHSPGIPEARLYALWVAIRVPLARRGFEAFVARDPEWWCHRNVHYYDESLKSLEEARLLAEPLRTPGGRRAFSHYLADTMSPWPMRTFVAELRGRRDRGERFPIPLQLVYATQDPMVPPRVGHALAALIPDAEVVWLERASHFAHVDAVDAFVEAVSPFLRR